MLVLVVRAASDVRRLAARVPAWVYACAACLVLLLAASQGRSTPYNNYVFLADAFLHGRVTIEHWPGPNTVDALVYNGKPTIIEGPFPALLMMPLVALWGLAANQTALAIFLCVVAVGAAWMLCTRLGCSTWTTAVLVLFLFAGTDLWWCSMLGDVWFVAHTAAVCATLLALLELTGKRRAWLVMLLAACAFESRFTLIFAVPFYLFVLLSPSGASRKAALYSSLAVLVPVALLWVLYNEARWGTPFDIGYTLFYHQDVWGQPTGSPFRVSYVPYELYSFFLQSPLLSEWRQQAQWPIFKVDPHGVALTFASPAMILAFLAREPRRLVIALWSTVVLVATPSILYYLDGWYQFGMRHALDFAPFILVLMALGVRERFPRWGIALCAYSALVGAWGVWYWDTFFRTGN